MTDREIIRLFQQRDERGIEETQKAYGAQLMRFAERFLSWEDAEECVNDTYLSAWNSIPPHRPQVLQTYLCKLCRNHALMRLRYNNAEKRGGGKAVLALDEIAGVIPGETEDAGECEAIKKCVREFVGELDADGKTVFLQRYFNFYDVKTIAKNTGFTQSKVKMMLKRSRDRLKNKLESEGLM